MSRPERLHQVAVTPPSDDRLMTLMERELLRAGLPERIRAKIVESASGCWEWTNEAGDVVDGYGRTSINGEPVALHRLMYELLVGPIPAGLHVDHIGCDNPPCCNPAHLRVCTQAENNQRAAARRPNHCPRGHEYTAENTNRDRQGSRFCRECRRLQAGARYRANRERALAQQAEYRKRKRVERGLSPVRVLAGHGTRACYRRGCRCEACMEGIRAYRRAEQPNQTVRTRERRRRARESS